MDGTRSYGQHGPRPTPYSEIEAWARLTDRDVQPHEVEALVMIDRVLCSPGDPKPEEDDG